MKIYKRNIVKVTIAFLLVGNVFASDDHAHDELKLDKVKEEKHDDHGDHKEHSDHGEEKGHDDHGHHDEGKAIGEGKAISKVDEDLGLKLSAKAIKTLGLELKSIPGNQFKLNETSLVVIKSKRGLYRYRNGYFKFLEVKIVKNMKKGILVKMDDFLFGDQLVTSSLGLLRISDVFSTDKSSYGHSH
jgi:hypothetical protein